jgi:hypothetical protein
LYARSLAPASAMRSTTVSLAVSIAAIEASS